MTIHFFTTGTGSSTVWSFFSATVFALLLVLLGGCRPMPQRPLAPLVLPENFSIQGNVPFSSSWWLDFDDPSLTQLIHEALSDNFSLLLVREKIAEARAIARRTGAALEPTIDGQGTASAVRNYTTNTSGENFLVGLAASYEIDLWGRLRNRRDAAILDVQATTADYYTAAITLAAETTLIWYQLVESELQLDLLSRQKDTNAKVLELISVKFRAGQVGIADVLQQRQLVESTIGALALLRADIQVLKHQLAILTGIAPGTLDLPRPHILLSLPPLPETGIPLDLLTNRPDITGSFLRLRASDQRVAAAIADRLPKLSIAAEVSTTGTNTGDLFNNWFSSLAANLFGPIVDGGLRQAEVARSESVVRQRLYAYRQIVLEAIGEVENSLIREKQQQLNLRSLETQLQYATESIEHIAHRYRQGAEDYQRVLLALLSQQSLQRTILAGQLRLITYRIGLYRALSGRIPFLITAITPNNIMNNQTDSPPLLPFTTARGSNE